MKNKALLLGSAAVLSAVGVAHAADAPTTAKPAQAVKPVNYVQVCDAYGLGYMIVPGYKDTCLRLQGSVEFQINFHTRDTEFWGPSTTSDREAGWDSQAIGSLIFTAKRMTDHGDLTGVIRLTATSNGSQNIQANYTPVAPNGGYRTPVDRYVQANQIYIQLGGFKVGYDSSIYGIGTTKQLSYEWDLPNKLVFKAALDDPRDRWGGRLPKYYWMPDVVGNVTQTTAWGSWGFSAGVADVQIGESPTSAFTAGTIPSGLVWGVSAQTTIAANNISKGDQFVFQVTAGTGCNFVVNNCGNGTKDTGNVMDQVVAQFKHVFDPNWNTTWKVTYTNPAPAAEKTALQANLVWTALSLQAPNGGGTGLVIQTTITGNQTVFLNPRPPAVFTGQIDFKLTY